MTPIASSNRALKFSRYLSVHGIVHLTTHYDKSIPVIENEKLLLFQINVRNSHLKRMNNPVQGNTSTRRRRAGQAARAVRQAAGLGNRHGGNMRIRRVLIIPAIVALGAVGAILPGSAMAATAAHAPSVHVHAAAASAGSNMYFHG
jgi:hypothetical protein